MYWIRRIVFAIAVFASIVLVAWAGPRFLDPTARDPAKQERDRRWISTSPYFLDRQACRWLSLCGLQHLRADPANRDYRRNAGQRSSHKAPAPNARPRPAGKATTRDIPDYVLKHAPLVHLYSGEDFWPSDIRDHITHMDIQLNQTVMNSSSPWDLDNMRDLNQLNGSVFLHSRNDVEKRPAWLHSRYNIPLPFSDGSEPGAEPSAATQHVSSTTLPHHPHAKPSEFSQGRVIDAPRGKQKLLSGLRYKQQQQQKKKTGLAQGHKPDSRGYSAAPAVLVLVDKGKGILDAFWFFFYSYNLGQMVLTMRFGNHVADWEHCMVRFRDGVPQGMYLSEHEGGQAYAWEAMEKRNVTMVKSDGSGSGAAERPVIYSALGSHAMYGTPGDHAYILPFKMLKDVTDRGPLWDPSLHNYAYHYNLKSDDDDDDGEDEDEDEDEDSQRNDHIETLAAEEEEEEEDKLVPASSNPAAPTSWFHFAGRWGDAVYPLADARQWRLFGQYHYVSGPLGPKFKNLGRRNMCLARRKKCVIHRQRDGAGTWY